MTGMTPTSLRPRGHCAGQATGRHSARRPGASHASVEARLGAVHAPALVVMGSLDPDFADPRAETQWIAGQLQGKALMVPGAGHYPKAEFPELVSPAIVAFARDLKPAVH